MAAPWSHSIHYHDLLLQAVPTGCETALDVGCGDGMFARRLAGLVAGVTAVDRSEAMIRLARAHSAGTPNLRFLHGDFFQLALPEGGYDYVASLAAAHHMEFRPEIERMRRLLRPDGVLAILGLARDRSPRDFATSALAVPTSRLLRLRRGWYQPGFEVKPPTMSYGEVRAAARDLLPGATFRRLLYFRYLLLWQEGQTVDVGATETILQLPMEGRTEEASDQ